MPNSTKLVRYLFKRCSADGAAIVSAPRAISIASLAVLFLLGSAAGCNKSAPPAPAASVKTIALGPDEAYKTLPPDMFKEMPVYPGSTIDHVRRPKGSMREIVFTADAAMPTLVAYFKAGLKQGNFHITSSLIMPARRTWSCDFHKEGRPGSIMLYPSDADKSKMTIDLIYEMPSKIDEAMLEPQEIFDVVGPGAVAQKGPGPKENTKQN
ncbi:MAG: hypothetical protein WA740_19345 [Candidatus Binataceae bacterium]